MTVRCFPSAALLVFLCASMGPGAFAGEASEPAAVELEAADSPGGKFTLPPGARVERDLAYGSAPGQKLDAYVSSGAKNAPILLMVHGGAWMFGDKGNSGVVANKVRHWLPRGYIVVSQNYRMGRPPDPLGQAEDVGRAIAFVQGHAASWGGDGSRVLLMGHSAGAHLVTLFTVAPDLVVRSGARPWLGTVSLDSAAIDLVELMNAPHARFFDRVFGTDAGRWAEVSPLHRLAAAPVPTLLVCSSRRSDSCAASRRFAAKATALGGRSTVLPIELGHGQINTELGQSPSYTASVDAFLRSLGLP